VNGDADLVEVVLQALPVEVHRRASEHSDELQREFALLRASSDAGADVPTRLLALIDEVGTRYRGFTEGTQQELLAAMERGDASIDLVYRVPPDVREATIHLGDLLDEADAFCRAGDLLTLAAPPEALAYRRWFLNEFVRQIDGEPPLPWPQFAG
jgi:hypothetical protein